MAKGTPVYITDKDGDPVDVTADGKIQVTAVFESGSAVGILDSNDVRIDPEKEPVNTTYEFVIVQAGDIGADYVAGSVGQYKTIKEYPTGAAGGTPAKLTTLKYADAVGPTKPTNIVESATTV